MIKEDNKYRLGLLRIIYALFLSISISIAILVAYDFSISIIGVLILLSFLVILFPIFFVKDIFHPFVILATSTLLALIDFLNKDLLSTSDSYTRYFSAYSLIVFICWYLFVYLGYILASKIRTNAASNPIFPNIKHSGKVSIIIGLITFLGFLFTLQIFGGVTGMIDAMTKTTVAYSGLGYLRLIVGLGEITAILLLYKGYNKISIIVLLITSILLSLFGGRANVILGTILPFLMVYHYSVKKIAFWKISLMGIFSLVFVQAMGVLRKSSESSFSIDGIWSVITNAASATGRANTVPWLIGSLLNGSVEYQFGKPLLNIFYAPIPRFIWEEKPEIIDDTVLIAYELIGSTSFGMPAGPYGQAFFNFGWIGVILFGFLTGYIVRRLYVKLILEDRFDKFMGVSFYALTIQSVFNIFSTSSQGKILWFIGVYMALYFSDAFFQIIFAKSYFLKRKKINNRNNNLIDQTPA